jgi:hypothetical protein
MNLHAGNAIQHEQDLEGAGPGVHPTRPTLEDSLSYQLRGVGSMLAPEVVVDIYATARQALAEASSIMMEEVFDAQRAAEDEASNRADREHRHQVRWFETVYDPAPAEPGVTAVGTIRRLGDPRQKKLVNFRSHGDRDEDERLPKPVRVPLVGMGEGVGAEDPDMLPVAATGEGEIGAVAVRVYPEPEPEAMDGQDWPQGQLAEEYDAAFEAHSRALAAASAAAVAEGLAAAEALDTEGDSTDEEPRLRVRPVPRFGYRPFPVNWVLEPVDGAI